MGQSQLNAIQTGDGVFILGVNCCDSFLGTVQIKSLESIMVGFIIGKVWWPSLSFWPPRQLMAFFGLFFSFSTWECEQENETICLPAWSLLSVTYMIRLGRSGQVGGEGVNLFLVEGVLPFNMRVVCPLLQNPSVNRIIRDHFWPVSNIFLGKVIEQEEAPEHLGLNRLSRALSAEF